MDTKHLSYFKVENFKRFDSLEVKDIGQFNLIVGDNNVGKTTLLEALLFDEVDHNQCLINFAYSLYKKGILLPNEKNYDFLEFFLSKKNRPLHFSFKYNHAETNSLIVVKKLYSEIESNKLQELQLSFLLNPNSGNGELNFAIEFDNGVDKDYKFTSHVPLNFHNVNAPFLSFNITYEEHREFFFSQLSISTQKLEQLITDLKLFIPDLVSIENNQALIPQRFIVAIRENGKDLLPLAQYGEGTIKLFRYLIKLNSFADRRLMIDEIDAGIHYSRMKDFLKKMIQTAKNKDVQIFATTHSKECLAYYTQALQELGYENEGRIIRLADTKSGIKAYTMRFEEFDNALYGNNEIR